MRWIHDLGVEKRFDEKKKKRRGCKRKSTKTVRRVRWERAVTGSPGEYSTCSSVSEKVTPDGVLSGGGENKDLRHLRTRDPLLVPEKHSSRSPGPSGLASARLMVFRKGVGEPGGRAISR